MLQVNVHQDRKFFGIGAAACCCRVQNAGAIWIPRTVYRHRGFKRLTDTTRSFFDPSVLIYGQDL